MLPVLGTVVPPFMLWLCCPLVLLTCACSFSFLLLIFSSHLTHVNLFSSRSIPEQLAPLLGRNDYVTPTMDRIR